MKMYKVRTDYDCLIKHSAGEDFLDINSSISFDSPEKILIYPLNETNKSSFPFTIDLDDRKSSRFFQRFNFNGINYIYITSLPYIKNQTLEEIEVNKINCKISISEENISFETNKNKKSFSLNNSFNTYSIYTEKSLVFLHLIGDLEDLWIYNVDNNKLFHIFGKKIEKIEKQLFVSKEIFDIANHQQYQTFEISNNEIIEKNNKLKYSLSTPQTTTNPLIIPIAFLEAIQIEDFALAKSYLTSDLQEQSDDEHLKKFFGKISKILPLEDNYIAIINEEKISIYQFFIREFLINEINFIE